MLPMRTRTRDVSILQVSIVLLEGREKELFGWVLPGGAEKSRPQTTLGPSCAISCFNFSSQHARWRKARRAVPIGSYERVMPLDILPTVLLRRSSGQRYRRRAGTGLSWA